MIRSMRVKNFTVFDDARFEFGALNIIHGENGSGKTHLLKLVHLAQAVSLASNVRDATKKPVSQWNEVFAAKANEYLSQYVAGQSVSSLVRRGKDIAEVEWAFKEKRSAKIAIDGNDYVRAVLKPVNKSVEVRDGVYIPPRDVLTLPSGYRELLARYELEEDPTAAELRDFVARPPLKVAKVDQRLKAVADLIEADAGVRATLKRDKFFISAGGVDDVPAQAAAMGHGKLALLPLLARRIEPGWTLCWDEPESNLNPRLIKVAARAILAFARADVQVFVASHSLFLLRALDIQIRRDRDPINTRFIGIRIGSGVAEIEQGAMFEDSGTIVSLEEDIRQADLYLNDQWTKK